MKQPRKRGKSNTGVKKDPKRTSVGDVRTKDKIVDKFLNGQDCRDVQEISVNYTDDSGNVKQEKISKEGHITQEGKVTHRSAKSIYEQAQRIKNNAVRSDKFMQTSAEDFNRIFSDSDGRCKPGKYIIGPDGKLVKA